MLLVSSLTLVGLKYLRRTVADAKVIFLYASNRCVYFLHMHKLPIIKRCFNLSFVVFKNCEIKKAAFREQPSSSFGVILTLLQKHLLSCVMSLSVIRAISKVFLQAA